ncbi:unnamed protein product [Strongylus vulgaris]|uniref:Anoctamin n=1 Tax=Strongylus vulgaris TaxID=40348 RepID=A0A3P7J9I7_STRVU|nr:unnamed protein product [Strongylus vulgaris]
METAVPFLMEKVKLSQLTYKMTKSMSEKTLRRHVEEVRKNSTLAEDLKWQRQPQAYFTLGSPTNEGIRKRFSQRRMAGKDNELHLLENLNQTEEFQLRSARLPLPEFKPSDSPELSQAELESLMAVYDRPLDDYLEMFIQFGYVLLFSPAFPLAALCAVVNNVIEIRVDAFKLCNTVQRPFGRQVKSIGAWQKAMEVCKILLADVIKQIVYISPSRSKKHSITIFCLPFNHITLGKAYLSLVTAVFMSECHFTLDQYPH